MRHFSSSASATTADVTLKGAYQVTLTPVEFFIAAKNATAEITVAGDRCFFGKLRRWQ